MLVFIFIWKARGLFQSGRGLVLISMGLLLFGAFSYASADILATFLFVVRLLMVLSVIWAMQILEKSHIRMLLLVLLMALLVQFLLAMGQIFLGQSLGFGWLMGESFINMQTPGTAKVTIFGLETLRGYGSLPHPNILGLFGFMSLLSFLLARRYIHIPHMALIGGLLSLGLIVLSFSKTFALLAVMVFMIQSRFFLYTIPVMLATFGGLGYIRGLQSVYERFVLYTPSTNMIRDHWQDGVGLFAYTHNLPLYLSEYPLWLLQPVHNTWLLIWAEMGIVYFAVFNLVLIIGIIASIWRFGLLGLAMSVSVIGILAIDHMLWTSVWGSVLLFCFFLCGIACKDTNGRV